MSWDLCRTHRAFIEEHLRNRVRLTKIRKLLNRMGVFILYGTLHRFARLELEFGRVRVTVPVADCGPGEEVQVDTGWVTKLEPDETGKRRRFRAWIFTAVLSRHRFVYPCFAESTATAIEACEAAWEYLGGVFKVLIPGDSTKAIVDRADPLHPRIVPAFLEYAQARGFHVDSTRVRQPTDKARVERSVTGLALPELIFVADGATHDVKIAKTMAIPPGSIVSMDRGDVDGKLFADLHDQDVLFVTRIKRGRSTG